VASLAKTQLGKKKLLLNAALQDVRREQWRHAAQTGLLQPLEKELSNTDDILSCSAALETVAELSQAQAGCAAALGAILESQLAALQRNPDTFLTGQALRVCLRLLSCMVPCGKSMSPR
jgi:hypothetical protein